MAGHRAAPSERAPRGLGCLHRESDSTAGRRAGPPRGMNDVPGCAGGQKTRAAGGGERRAAPRGTRVRGGPGRGARGVGERGRSCGVELARRRLSGSPALCPGERSVTAFAWGGGPPRAHPLAPRPLGLGPVGRVLDPAAPGGPRGQGARADALLSDN